MEREIDSFLLVEDSSAIELASVSTPLWWYVLGVVVLLLLIAVALFFILPKKSKSLESVKAKAYKEAKFALRNLPQKDLRQVPTYVSELVRAYLVAVAQDPALFETREEFVSRADHLNFLNQENRQFTLRFLDRSADHKYSPDTLDGESAEGLIAAAHNLLDQLNNAE